VATSRIAGRRGVLALLCVLVALGLAVAGCGGSESESADGAGVEPTFTSEADETEEADEADDGGAASAGQGSATLEFGGESYEFTTDTGCVVLDSLVSVSMGKYGVENHMSLTRAGDVVLVRVSVDGQDWEQSGEAPEPEVAGSTATWNGDIVADGSGATETVTITAMC
jgi:hypothetical protein